MRLEYGELESLARDTMKEEKALKSLRTELKKAFGPSVDCSARLSRLAEAVNYELDIVEHSKGNNGFPSVDQTILRKFANNADANVRKMVARLVNENALKAFIHDPNRGVRLVAAKRLPLSLVGKMIKRFPMDEQLTYIFNNRKRLAEAGMPDPDVIDDPMETYGKTPLGDVVREPLAAEELGDQWYVSTARDLLHKYGQHNIEFNWEEKAVKSLCDHTYATSGVEIDAEKLLSAVFDVIEEEEQLRIAKSTLEEASNSLRTSAINESMLQPVFEIHEDPADDIMNELASLRTSDAEFVKICSETLRIRESRVAKSLRKFVFQEGMSADMHIPMKAQLPHNFGLRAVDEKVLDMFVESWNKLQAFAGEPVEIEWSPDPSDIRNISFSAMLK